MSGLAGWARGRGLALGLVTGLLACTSQPPAATPPPWFVDKTTDSKVHHVQFPKDPHLGAGIGVGDLDGDGVDDLVLTATVGTNRVWRGLGDGTFEEYSTQAQLTTEASAHTVALADLDNDGDLDVVLAGTSLEIWTNNGGGQLTNTSAAAAVEGLAVHTAVQVLPLDFDGDGWLDLFVVEHGRANLLLLRQSDGTYANRATEVGLTRSDLTWTATWYDADGDGDSDLFLTTDTFEPDFGRAPEYDPAKRSPTSDRLYLIDGVDPASGRPLLVDATAAAQVDIPRSSMAAITSDFNGDGRLDLFLSDNGRNHLLNFDPATAAFTYVTEALGLHEPLESSGDCQAVARPFGYCLLVTWGAVHLDFDGDGWPDLVTVNGGFDPEYILGEPVVVHRNLGLSGGYVHVPGDTAPDALIKARGLVPSDIDGDGDLDLIVGAWAEPVRVLENTTSQGGGWLQVRLQGTASNRDGVGATVQVTLSDGRTLVQAVGAGGIAQGSALLRPWFGLGDATVTGVTVRWPSGVVQPNAALPGPGKHTLVVVEPELVVLGGGHVMADGSDDVLVTVTPRDDAGAPLGPGHKVTFAATLGTLGAVEELADGRYRVALRGAGVAGDARVLIEVDGRRLAVVPRIGIRP